MNVPKSLVEHVVVVEGHNRSATLQKIPREPLQRCSLDFTILSFLDPRQQLFAQSHLENSKFTLCFSTVVRHAAQTSEQRFEI